jgi:diaminopimelate decarboxylase/aspartate kinase
MSDLRPWVVLKFGGTSVASRARWDTILELARARLAAGERPLIVCSAVTGVSNLLESAITAAAKGEHGPALEEVHRRHRALAEGLGVDHDTCAGDLATDLDRLLLGASLLGEVSARQHARVMSAGELIATRLGAAFLRESGLDVRFLDARAVLRSIDPPEARDATRFLQATLSDDPDPALEAELRDGPEVVVTQGFIARTPDGATCLLGRGGSDTSAALFAARVMAARCEIWTDVPGMFSANPRQVPDARLLRRLGYGEAQEVASTGAKVLHPRCLPPVARHRIPMVVKCTPQPELPGTWIQDGVTGGPRVFAISCKVGVTLVRMDAVSMWQQVGFLADVFGCFRARGLSVDLVSTAETNVTVTLDPTATAYDRTVLDGLVRDLSRYCSAQVVPGCAAVSVVGRRIRGMLHRLGPALAAFEEHRVHLVTQASSDLNLTVVVDESQAEPLVAALHAMLFDDVQDEEIGPAWRSLGQGEAPASSRIPRWWEKERQRLIAACADGPRYVVYGPAVDASAAGLLALPGVDRVLYAVKANPHPDILLRLARQGVGFECVSVGEMERVFSAIPDLAPERVLFTPNFAPRAELQEAVRLGVRLGIDGLFLLESWGADFSGRAVQLRVDLGSGRGHHDHVRTGGSKSKFGMLVQDLPRALEVCRTYGITVEGLHTHAGSGILDATHWTEVAMALADVARAIPTVRYLDLGGGLGVPEKPGQQPLDLAQLGAGMARVRAAHPHLSLWLEPGRYLVATAGVLLARVTQIKEKGGRTFVGTETGMNSLIRPALYGAWHDVINLSRWGEDVGGIVTVVGPICESGDVIGRDRGLPACKEGDVLLIDVTGAYGSAMASQYNLRPPAPEIVMEA